MKEQTCQCLKDIYIRFADGEIITLLIIFMKSEAYFLVLAQWAMLLIITKNILMCLNIFLTNSFIQQWQNITRLMPEVHLGNIAPMFPTLTF